MKPAFRRSPIAWLRRQVRLKLCDLLWTAGLRVVERVDFRALSGAGFAHVIDVGVAHGTPDLYARMPLAYLDLFEPNPQYHREIETSVLRGRHGRLHRVALGAAEGKATLHVKGTGSSLVTDHGRGSIDVSVQRLDAILTPASLRTPCLLKIDAEGYELEVLRGAEALLDHIDCVVVEIHFHVPQQYRPSDLIAFLAARGFGMVEMLDFHVGRERVHCADFVFRRVSQAPIQGAVPATRVVAAE